MERMSHQIVANHQMRTRATGVEERAETVGAEGQVNENKGRAHRGKGIQ